MSESSYNSRNYNSNNNSTFNSTKNPYRPYVDLPDSGQLNPYLFTSPANLSDVNSLNFNLGMEAQDDHRVWGLITYGFIKYVTTAMASPFEVAHTLMQVQHLPMQFKVELDRLKKVQEELEDGDSDEFDSDDDILNDNQEDSDEPSYNDNFNKSIIDRRGYVIESEVDLIASKPNYQLEYLDNGLWSTMYKLAKHPNEGILSLWKGQFTYWLYDMSQLFLQPTIEATLNDTFDLYDDTIPLVHLDTVLPNIATIVTSNLLTGLILNPLDLIRTRLIVQSGESSLQKYHGPLHAFFTIIQEEGVETLFYGEDLIPSLLYHTISPLMQQLAPLIIDRWLHISPLESPFLYGFSELALNLLELMITLPLDTIRKRLQAQPRPKLPLQKPFATVVRTRQAPYAGPIDTIFRMVVEEARPGLPKRKILLSATQLERIGIASLYQGFGFHATTVICTSLVSSFVGIKGDNDW